MERLKVIHVLYSGLGGHGNVVFPLIESDFGEQFDNTLVFFGIEPVLPAYRKMCQERKVPFHAIIKKPRTYLKAFSRFREILAKIKPDRIIIHSNELIIPAVRYCRNTTCKSFYVEHENNATKGISLRYFTKFALTRSSGVVCLNPNYAQELQAKYKCNAPIHVIPNGINTAKFKPFPSRTKEAVLGMASRMIPGKDHETLLKALCIVREQFPCVKLKIAGEGETLAKIEEEIQLLDLEDHVIMLGLLNEDEMISFYDSISLYVLATKSETMSTAILQSMACGLPVITSGIPNNATLIEEGETGWLYEDGNHIDLAKKINFALKYTALTASVGKAARQHILDHYSNVYMSEQYCNLVK